MSTSSSTAATASSSSNNNGTPTKNGKKGSKKKKKGSTDNNEQQPRQQQEFKLSVSVLLLMAIGFCAIVIACINVMHVHGTDHLVLTHYLTPVHAAMQEFKKPSKEGAVQVGNTVIRRKGQEDEVIEHPKPMMKRQEDLHDTTFNHQPLGNHYEAPPGAVEAEKAGMAAWKRGMAEDGSTRKGWSNEIVQPQLNCEAYGGPSVEDAQEMVYWRDIESDGRYVSPFHMKLKDDSTTTTTCPRQYMTFEPDGGGWNNIRMAMETVLGLAIAMGRTLVLPPAIRMYLLSKDRSKQKTHFSFADFFPMKELAEEHDGLHMISMKEFLELEAMTGHLKNKETGEISFPPGNRTDWEQSDQDDWKTLKEWLRTVTLTPLWSPGRCLAAFPASGDHQDLQVLQNMQQEIHKNGQSMDRSPILQNPGPVDASPMERMKENLSGRRELCVYDQEMQQAPVVHFMCYHKMRVRMLVHFYAFLYFEDWREDLWMKRFMRDHVRYIDEIQCAAARIVKAMRDYAKSVSSSDQFDTFHVRRGDFQFKNTRISAEQIYDNTKSLLKEGAVIYMATDERNKNFFDPLRKHYKMKSMDDFLPLLKGVNTNFYGMIDQLVASRGRLFFGCWHSTFTGFIHRMRGYHSVYEKRAGYENGQLFDSYYYVPLDKQRAMHSYAALHGAFFNREFPTSWRDLNKGIGKLPNIMESSS